jgi:hypothetical protein
MISQKDIDDVAGIEERNRIDSLCSGAEMESSGGRRVVVEAVRDECSSTGMSLSVEFGDSLICIVRSCGASASRRLGMRRSRCFGQEKIEIDLPEKEDAWNHIRVYHQYLHVEVEADVEQYMGSSRELLLKVVVDREHRLVIVPCRKGDAMVGIGIRRVPDLSQALVEVFEINVPEGVLRHHQ